MLRKFEHALVYLCLINSTVGLFLMPHIIMLATWCFHPLMLVYVGLHTAFILSVWLGWIDWPDAIKQSIEQQNQLNKTDHVK